MNRSLTLAALLTLSAALHAAPQRDVADPPSTAINEQASVRQFVVEPEHVFTDEQVAALAAQGIEVRQALAGGRYIVRTAPGAVLSMDGLWLRSAEPLTADVKIHPTAAAMAARRFARVGIIFDDGVSFDQAEAIIRAAGGTLDDPLALELGPLNRVVALIAPGQLKALASSDSVIAVFGAPRLKMAVDNAAEAALSNVTQLYSAPYGLSGAGVALSFFELAAADATHPEFGGRLTNKFTGGAQGDADHATHTAGTMIASGINPAAKGMAPAATLFGFNATSSSYLTTKEKSVTPLGAVADNNSWGYVLGWNSDDSGDWVWTGNDDLYGGYIDIDATLDKITRSTNLLMLHSAGNEAQKNGPTTAPFIHKHEDDNGDKIPDKIFCYSANGSGSDCPAPCTAGSQYCEVTRHPVNAPYSSIGLTASAKNIVTVGAVTGGKNIANFSSRGPTRDGRVKPDVVAKGTAVTSTMPNNSYADKQGTSMSTPVVTGISALIVEQWRKTFAGANPPAAAIKALLIAGAEDLGTTGPDYTFGWGLVNAQKSIDSIRTDNAQGTQIRIATVAQGGQAEFPMTATAGQPLRATIVWSDPEVVLLANELADATLVNDLDLKIIDPSGNTLLPYKLNKDTPDQAATRGVNTVDNVEVVDVASPVSGTYRAVVSGTRITASSPQQYVFVSSAPIGSAAPPCTDPNEPNDAAETATGFLVGTQSTSGRICSSTDVDFFKFTVERPGTVSATVKSVDTPLRVTLTQTGGASVSQDIAAGATGTVQTAFSGSTKTVFTVKIEAAGALGASGAYTVMPNYTLPAAPHRRTAR